MKFTDEIIFYAALFAVVQVVDGLCTGIGVSLFGLQAEGNFVLRSAMQIFGCWQAIIIVKIVAFAAIGGMVWLTNHLFWAKN